MAGALLPALIIALGVVLPFIILARIVVLSVRNAGKVADGRCPFRPSREKARNDVIAHIELCDALADGFYKARAVRHWDAAVGYSVGRADNAIIMEVE